MIAPRISTIPRRKEKLQNIKNLQNKPKKQSNRQLETQLYKAVRKFLIISELFISAPMGVHSENFSKTCWHRTLQFVHLLWCLFIFSIFSTCVYIEYTESNIDLPTVQKPLYFCEYIVYLVHLFQILIAIHYSRQKFRQFLCTIIEFDERLMELGIKANYSIISKFLHRHLLLILVHFLTTVIIGYYYADCVISSFLRSTTVYTLPNIIIHISLAQYYGLLYGIAVRAVNLNYVLRCQLTTSASDPLLLHGSLNNIRLLYSKLELFTKDVNDAFAQSVVLIYVGSFMNISVNIFLIYKYMDNPGTSDMAWIMYSVVWTCMHIGKMFLILYYNYCVQNQKNTTALFLNDIKGQNSAIEETISHFILQLIINTRSNVVCGVAQLNMDFIASLLVAISTLFIFLLQYDITFEALTKTRSSATPTRKS